ncbi:MAG: hypothetical protein JWO47_1091 [Candidatus Saccharibacteria bacterium]|nr:hypothetical protein [Candidatus Saccharibacteria bacterium]
MVRHNNPIRDALIDSISSEMHEQRVANAAAGARARQGLVDSAAEIVVGWWMTTPEDYKDMVRSDATHLGVYALKDLKHTYGHYDVLIDVASTAVKTIDTI